MTLTVVRTNCASCNLQRLSRSAVLTATDHLAIRNKSPPVQTPRVQNNTCLYQGDLKPSKESMSLQAPLLLLSVVLLVAIRWAWRGN